MAMGTTGIILVLIVIAFGLFGGWKYLHKVTHPGESQAQLDKEFGSGFLHI